MPYPLIDRYHNDLAKALQFGKSTNEQSVRGYFWILLNEYARKQNFEVVLEKRILGTHGVQVQPDGALQNSWGLTLGIWESKDTKDDLEEEVDKKQKKGYPLTNALFEDTQHAVLFQYGEEVMRVDMKDSAKLHKLLLQWLSFKNATVVEFEKALDNFKADIPQLLEHLQRELIAAGSKNKDFILARDAFLELCRHEINPEVTVEDVREMLIQHLLTAELFQKIFDEPDFHRQNNIARELEKLLGTVFDYERRKNLLASIEHYYEAINATAAGITDHHEKQKFLKVLYENFYKAYNPKAADRLGVVYTPNEIVRFMVRSTDQLLHQHFGKSLSDEHVEILDPATGTGTFICDIIDHIPPHKLTYKYAEEIHANEVAILPYYVANLNIEFTFKQKMGHYKQFPNLCFVDTLDNTAGLGAGVQHDIFGISSENATRIRRQNERRISVVIGNPPYNAKQENYNYQNSNRAYKVIDKRVKDTYVKHGTAQNQIVVYDMYTRFYRWAMDRVDKNGIIAFITNRSFIDSRAFDGFRKCVQDEF
ncbi:MAG: N-6 DNA methylase, partial [Flavobacteriales bacterium]|nr:N-6 DNA methylase [Flavobacteriales bacterium]